MIKTVKVKKQLRVDDFIKYIFDNGIEGTSFLASEVAPFAQCEARVNGSGNIKISGYINKHTTFTVEVEEEITKDTKFVWLVEASNTRIWNQKNASIGDVLDERTTEIRALINGKLELIWEADSDEL